ncbi:Arm DNA-binding domain-containing protein [Undibacterium sp. SXout20W]|uniref:Arm DNA-binding domain-containing protein n=1 Tax=Undibacterium sp. SXout20W TaxID=3413051 RepID=UPI003BF263AC
MTVYLTVSCHTVKYTVKLPKLFIPLTDIQPRTAKPKTKPYKLTDGGGRYLLINSDGSKYLRMDYRLGETRKTLAFGKNPEISLSEARNKRLAARKLLDRDIDLSQTKTLIFEGGMAASRLTAFASRSDL